MVAKVPSPYTAVHTADERRRIERRLWQDFDRLRAVVRRTMRACGHCAAEEVAKRIAWVVGLVRRLRRLGTLRAASCGWA
jgi:hypothetical protein